MLPRRGITLQPSYYTWIPTSLDIQIFIIDGNPPIRSNGHPHRFLISVSFFSFYRSPLVRNLRFPNGPRSYLPASHRRIYPRRPAARQRRVLGALVARGRAFSAGPAGARCGETRGRPPGKSVGGPYVFRTLKRAFPTAVRLTPYFGTSNCRAKCDYLRRGVPYRLDPRQAENPHPATPPPHKHTLEE